MYCLPSRPHCHPHPHIPGSGPLPNRCPLIGATAHTFDVGVGCGSGFGSLKTFLGVGLGGLRALCGGGALCGRAALEGGMRPRGSRNGRGGGVGVW